MAILTSFRLPGDPHELLAQGRQTFSVQLRELAAQHGQLTQVIVDEGDGLRVFDLWESEDGMLHARERACLITGVAGLLQQERRQWDVLHHQIYAGATRAHHVPSPWWNARATPDLIPPPPTKNRAR